MDSEIFCVDSGQISGRWWIIRFMLASLRNWHLRRRRDENGGKIIHDVVWLSISQDFYMFCVLICESNSLIEMES